MSWIRTYTNKRFDFLNPTPDSICIEDIAHALSLTNRYGGHTGKGYSVAEHSYIVSHFVPPEYALQGLMHDAAEAYTGDIPSPLKALLPDFKVIEKNVEDVINLKYGLPLTYHPSVKEMDLKVLHTEMDQLNDNWVEDLFIGSPRLDFNFHKQPWCAQMAKLNFILRFEKLTKQRGVKYG